MAFNSIDYLRVLLAAIASYSDTRIIEIVVVDNGSRDGTALWLSSQPGVRCISLPLNIMHGPALDLGCFVARGETLVVIDVDAFPISPNWLDTVAGPLDRGVTLCGGRFEFRGITFPHPCIAAIRADRFRAMRHSWAPVRRRRTLLLDTGCSMSIAEWGNTELLEATEVLGSGFLGTVFSDAVFHLFFGTRARRSTDPDLQRLALAASEIYRSAVERYHPALLPLCEPTYQR